MRVFLRALAYLGTWLLVTLACAIAGVWWAAHDAPESAGAGIGALIYGGLGLMVGAMLGILTIGYLHNLRERRKAVKP